MESYEKPTNSGSSSHETLGFLKQHKIQNKTRAKKLPTSKKFNFMQHKLPKKKKYPGPYRRYTKNIFFILLFKCIISNISMLDSIKKS